jgi:hypothetical protein
MKRDKQPRRASKDVSLDRLHPRSDMSTRALGGDKESNEPLRRPLKGGSGQPQNTPPRKPSR